MRKSRKDISALLAAASLVSVASCGGGGRGAAGGDSTTAATTTTPATTPQTNDTDAKVQEVAGNVELEELKVEKKIKWLAWWPIDETSAPVELFKANYGIPEEGDQSYGDYADKVFVYTNVAYHDRYDKLGQMVSSGDSPDIFPFEIGYFPLSAYKGMFQPIDGVIDTYSEEWADTREDMDKFMWGGKNYCPIPKVNTDSLYWYRRSVVQEAGLDDPYELYKAGNWTWDTFLDMADKFQQSGENKFIIDGWSVSEKLLATTGTPLVSIEDGKLVSNLSTPAVERGMALAETLCSENYRYPRHELNNWSINYVAWANGDTLFMDEGTYFWEERGYKYAKKFEWDEGDVFFVPAPRDPSSDTYYQSMKQDAIMWCAGSTNKAGYQAWIASNLAATKDADVVAAAREKSKRDYNWTDEMLDFLEELERDMVAVWDFKNGISTAAADTSAMENSPVESLLKIPYVTGEKSYTQLRSEKQGEVDTAIAEMNASVA